MPTKVLTLLFSFNYLQIQYLVLSIMSIPRNDNRVICNMWQDNNNNNSCITTIILIQSQSPLSQYSITTEPHKSKTFQ